MAPRALTTTEAATLAGLTPGGFRAAMTQERKKGVDLRLPADQWPDKRTPMWDSARIKTWIKSRPGSGYWGPRPVQKHE